MGEAVKELVINLSVEQKVQALKAPSTEPIKKWRQAHLQAYNDIAKNAVARERQIQAELDRTISRMQTLLNLERQRGSMPGRDPNSGRFTKRSGLASGLMGAANLIPGLGSDPNFDTAKEVATTIWEHRAEIAEASRRAVKAGVKFYKSPLGPAAAVGALGYATLKPLQMALVQNYTEQNAAALRQGATLDARRMALRGAQQAAAERVAGQYQSATAAMGTPIDERLVGQRNYIDRAAILRQSLAATRYSTPQAIITRADDAAGRFGGLGGLNIAAGQLNAAAGLQQSRIARQQELIAATRGQFQTTLGYQDAAIAGLSGGIARRNAAQAAVAMERQQQTGGRLGYLGVDKFEARKIENLARNGLETGDDKTLIGVLSRLDPSNPAFGNVQAELEKRAKRSAAYQATTRLPGFDDAVGLRAAEKQRADAEAGLRAPIVEAQARTGRIGEKNANPEKLLEQLISDREKLIEKQNRVNDEEVAALEKMQVALAKILAAAEGYNERISKLESAASAAVR